MLFTITEKKIFNQMLNAFIKTLFLKHLPSYLYLN